MNIIQITPGAGGMFCGGCFRDNALVAALRKLNHHALMVPLYLPLTLEEPDTSSGVPIFFSGINVYLEQKFPAFRHAPHWVRRLFSGRKILKWAAGSAAKTRPTDLGELTVSMIRGEQGFQARELAELIAWLKQHETPDIICLSNVLLAGLVHEFKHQLRKPVVCMLQGEDSFLDSLTPPYRDLAWKTLAERAREVDVFVAPSEYFAQLMRHRLSLGSDQVRVIYNGIPLEGFYPAVATPAVPTLGYFARMCREKGLDRFVDTFILLKKRGRIPNLQLRAGGGLSPADVPFVESLKSRLQDAGFDRDAAFFPNLDRTGKQDFFRSLSVLSVPALYGEAFGLYLLEAWACGVPVVQPRHAAFPELIEITGGGLIAEQNSAEGLAEAIEKILLTPGLAVDLGAAGRKQVLEKFTMELMARKVVELYEEILQQTATAEALADKSTWLAG